MDDSWAEDVADDEVQEDDRARVKAELDPDERLLWLGRPIPRLAPLGRGTAVFATVAALAWIVGIGCIAWLVRAGWRDGDAAVIAKPAFFLAVVLSVGLTLYFLTRRLERSRLRGTLYALTDRRAIIWKPSSRAGGVEVHSIGRVDVKRVYRIEYPDGSGDVMFTDPVEAEAYLLPFGFEKVPEVVRVERLVREAILSDERM